MESYNEYVKKRKTGAADMEGKKYKAYLQWLCEEWPLKEILWSLLPAPWLTTRLGLTAKTNCHALSLMSVDVLNPLNAVLIIQVEVADETLLINSHMR